jgi:hypothetical protein
MQNVDLTALVDGAIADCQLAGLPLLPVPLTQALACVLTQGMPDDDRLRVTVEIAATVIHRVNSFQRKQAGQMRYVA